MADSSETLADLIVHEKRLLEAAVLPLVKHFEQKTGFRLSLIEISHSSREGFAGFDGDEGVSDTARQLALRAKVVL